MKKGLLSIVLLALVAVAHAQYPLVTIEDIQTVSQANLGNCDDESTYLNDTVRVRGVVVVDGGLSQIVDGRQVWIQDSLGAFRGLDVFGSDPTSTQPVDQLLAGLEIEITGVVINFNGETEIDPLPGSSVSILSSGNTVQKQVVALSDLNDQNRNNLLTTGEQWEGAYAEVQNLTVSSVDFFSGGSRVSFNVQDAGGNTMNVSDRFLVQRLPANGGTFTAPFVGDQYSSISGVIIHSKNDCPNNNGRGYEIHPFEAAHYVPGASVPKILNVTRTPSNPNSSQSVVISAEISDFDGVITSAVMHYAVGASTSTYTAVNMNNTTGNTYEATIPAQSDGSFVKYYLEATDDSTNTTTVPNPNPSDETYFYTVRDNGLTIFDVQFTPFSNGNSGYLGTEVTVTGVVTSSAQATDLGYVYIQEENQLAWAGILVQGNPSLATLNRGDKVTVTGTVEESFGFTRIGAVSSVQPAGTGTITPVGLSPDLFTTYDFATTEQYESMLLALTSPTAGDKIHVVDANPDDPSNFGEYRVGADQFDPNTGSRILVGRQSGSAFSSLNVSYVNDTTWATTDGIMNVPALVVSDTVNMDTLCGIMYYSFGSMKLLPRNNDDYKGINLGAPVDTNDTNVSVQFLNQLERKALAFPNPADQELNVWTNFRNGEVYTITLFDLAGREVFRRITMNAQETIYLNSFDNGTYLVRVSDPAGKPVETFRIVVTH